MIARHFRLAAGRQSVYHGRQPRISELAVFQRFFYGDRLIAREVPPIMLKNALGKRRGAPYAKSSYESATTRPSGRGMSSQWVRFEPPGTWKVVAPAFVLRMLGTLLAYDRG